jgi:GT2 family glycosyltransferase
VGVFREELFYAREEEELCLRLLDAGYDVAYLPLATVRHKRSFEARTIKPRKLALDLRNMLLVTWLYFPFAAAMRLTALRVVVYLARSIKLGCPGAAFRGAIEAAALLPRALAERRPIRSTTYRRYLVLNPRSRWWQFLTAEPLPVPHRHEDFDAT